MEFNIEVDDRELEGFTEEAVIQLNKEIKKYSNNLIKEAILYEAGESEGNSPKEVTANHVNIVSKPKKVEIKKSGPKLVIMKIISTISLTIVGFFYEYPFSSYSRFSIFLLLMVIGAVSTVIVNMKENQ